ncbi:MAG: hypothetical protein KC441_19540, partial [Anaerolineales bacterium]|nr:hypothetical protein [Anaerolineales bacterium]
MVEIDIASPEPQVVNYLQSTTCCRLESLLLCVVDFEIDIDFWRRVGKMPPTSAEVAKPAD